MSNNDRLQRIVAELINRDTKVIKKLPKGLILAYTPVTENGGNHRLTLSRVRVMPSDTELVIVERILRVTLDAQNRKLADMTRQRNQQRGDYHFHTIEWKEINQPALL